MTPAPRHPPVLLTVGLSHSQADPDKPFESPGGIRTRGRPLRLREALACSFHSRPAVGRARLAAYGRMSTCARSGEHTAGHNAPNFDAKHAPPPRRVSFLADPRLPRERPSNLTSSAQMRLLRRPNQTDNYVSLRLQSGGAADAGGD